MSILLMALSMALSRRLSHARTVMTTQANVASPNSLMSWSKSSSVSSAGRLLTITTDNSSSPIGLR